MRAGIGVFACLALAAGILWAADWWEARGKVTYILTCTPEQGVYGLKPGSPVRVGGLLLGEVVSVGPSFEGESLVGYHVEFVLSRQVVLYKQARIVASVGGLAGDGFVEIADTGRGRTVTGVRSGELTDPGVLPPNAIIAATAPNDYEWIVGHSSAKAVGHLATRLPEAWAQLKEMGADVSPRLERTKGEWNALLEAIRTDLPGWRAQWATLTERAERAVAKLGAGEGAAADAVVPTLRAVKDDFSKINVAGMRDRLQMPRHALSQAAATLDALQAQAYAARTALGDPDLNLGFAKADFAIAGAELSATKREVMAQLWTIVGWPTGQQQRQAWREDEARIFAEAAAEFDRAVHSIRQTVDRDAKLLATSPGLAELLATSVSQASAQFDAAMERYGRVLMLKPAP